MGLLIHDQIPMPIYLKLASKEATMCSLILYPKILSQWQYTWKGNLAIGRKPWIRSEGRDAIG